MASFAGIASALPRLCQLPRRYHWSYADQSLMFAISRGERLERGVIGSRLRLMLSWGMRVRLHWLLILAIGVIELTRLLLRQQKGGNGSPPGNLPPDRLFVGFGAGSEDDLFQHYCQDHGGRIVRLDQTDVRSFAAWHRLRMIHAFRALAYSLGVARNAMADLPADIVSRRVDFLTFVGMRLGYHAYMYGWFLSLRDDPAAHIKEVVFISADTAAFAAVEAGLETMYVQHGLLSLSLLLPQFGKVRALTGDEAAYLRLRLPYAQIDLAEHQRFILPIRQMKREALITSIYGTHDYMFESIDPFLRWAVQIELPVRVRPHPCESHTFWDSYSRRGMVEIEKQDATFLQSIERLRPRINVSWFSTTLADSLDYGIIPVTVCADDDREVNDTVYPLFRRCLRWPQDAESVNRLLIDDDYYQSVLASLRSGSGRTDI